MDANEINAEKAGWILRAVSNPTKQYLTASYLPSHKASKLDKQVMLGTAGEVKTNS